MQMSVPGVLMQEDIHVFQQKYYSGQNNSGHVTLLIHLCVLESIAMHICISQWWQC